MLNDFWVFGYSFNFFVVVGLLYNCYTTQTASVSQNILSAFTVSNVRFHDGNVKLHLKTRKCSCSWLGKFASVATFVVIVTNFKQFHVSILNHLVAIWLDFVTKYCCDFKKKCLCKIPAMHRGTKPIKIQILHISYDTCNIWSSSLKHRLSANARKNDLN